MRPTARWWKPPPRPPRRWWRVPARAPRSKLSVPAEASSSVEADDTVSTISPIMASKSRVMPSTRRPRSILASASRAAASSAAFLAISASLNTCKASAMAPISVFSPRRVTAAVRSPLPSACIGFTIAGNPVREVADQIHPDADAADDDGSDNAQHEPECRIVTFGGLPGRGVRTRVVEIDALLEERIGFGGDDRNLLGDGFARLSGNPPDALRATAR